MAKPDLVRTGAFTAVAIALLCGCSRSPKEVATGDAAPPIATPPSQLAPSPPGSAGPAAGINRAKAEQIALVYARQHWAEFEPSVATGLMLHPGTYQVVVGFQKRGDAASVMVQASDGAILDAKIAPQPAPTSRRLPR